MQSDSQKTKFIVGILGGKNVGKTCLESRFVENKFPTNRYRSTLDTTFMYSSKNLVIDKKQTTLMIKNVHSLCLFHPDNFWDFIHRTWKFQGVLLCYAANSRESFDKIQEVLGYGQDHVQEFCMILVATKSDANNICVEYQEDKELADKYGLKFFEISAKENSFVEEVFYEITEQMIEKCELLSESKQKESLLPKIEGKEKNINTKTTCGCF